MTSLDSVESNLSQIENLFRLIPSTEKIDLILFPENTLFMRLREGAEIEAMDLDDPVIRRLEGIARQRKCFIHIGASPLVIKGSKYNSSLLIGPTGDSVASYQKMHLFDIALEGAVPIRESDQFCHGALPSIVDINGWRVGESICYDLRFGELFSYYAQNEVDLILVPAAFLVPTGKAHWEVLLRARAIECQAYVAASAQSGVHESESSGGRRETYGNSMVVDPWGQVLVKLTQSPQVEILTLEKKQIHKVRSQIPMRLHRRIHIKI